MRRYSVLSKAILLSLSMAATPAAYANKIQPNSLQREQQLKVVRETLNEAKAFLKKNAGKAKVIKSAKGDRRNLESGRQKKPWATLDSKNDGVEGTSTEKVYEKYASAIAASQKQRPVVVAVIDSGVDIYHEDLKGKIWVNDIEAAGVPGVDDDNNGYIDDVYGWNFLGNAKGENVVAQTLEVTREYARLSKKKAAGGLTPDEEAYFSKVAGDYHFSKLESESMFEMYDKMKRRLQAIFAILRTEGLKDETIDSVRAIESDDELVLAAKAAAILMLDGGYSLAMLSEFADHYSTEVNYWYNTEFDSSKIVGDDSANMNEKGYGSPVVHVEGDEHGTHVSGIIAADRSNDLGIFGQASNVKIMVIRAVPDGDERDKDVANAVRYAVENGAQIINMSFGKSYSPNKDAVDAAFAYAEKMGVLVVHAAGNSAKNTEVDNNFPTKKALADSSGVSALFSNWIEVGASSSKRGPYLTASFSNYGKTSVDVFAPGVGILSSVPQNGYDSYDGTSMASPEVAGVAALLLSLKPELKVSELREALVSTVQTYTDLKVKQPGTSQDVLFSDLSASGGIVNAFNAVQKVLN